MGKKKEETIDKNASDVSENENCLAYLRRGDGTENAESNHASVFTLRKGGDGCKNLVFDVAGKEEKMSEI